MTIRIANPYGSYGSPICMGHTDHQSICSSRTSSSPATKTDHNPSYTPQQRTYTIVEQIHFQTALNESNIH